MKTTIPEVGVVTDQEVRMFQRDLSNKIEESTRIAKETDARFVRNVDTLVDVLMRTVDDLPLVNGCVLRVYVTWPHTEIRTLFPAGNRENPIGYATVSLLAVPVSYSGKPVTIHSKSAFEFLRIEVDSNTKTPYHVSDDLRSTIQDYRYESVRDLMADIVCVVAHRVAVTCVS